jgi:hypothetical protein
MPRIKGKFVPVASEGIAPAFLIQALVVGQWWASRLGRFTPGEVASGPH